MAELTSFGGGFGRFVEISFFLLDEGEFELLSLDRVFHLYRFEIL